MAGAGYDPAAVLPMAWIFVVLTFVAAGYSAGFACGMNPSAPSDWVMNLGDVPHATALDAEHRDTLVVLQHGLWRSARALGRLERALRKHGYDVLNVSYPSTIGTVEEHAARLGAAIDAHVAARGGRPQRVAFVGHSLGGLVIRSYLARDGALPAWRVVFVGTPQRGAVLAQARKSSAWFRLLMGDRAALQLLPGDPLYATLPPVRAERIGVLFGHRGDGVGWNDAIPGDDDGTVGVAETALAEADAQVGMLLGHTRISYARPAIVEVLTFLRHGHFTAPAPR